jgi:hypothetical protein
MSRYPLGVIEPAIRLVGHPRFLPFWKLDAAWVLRAGEDQTRSYRHFPTGGSLLFPAFWRPRFSYHADLTWRFLMLGAPVPCGPPKDPFLGGIRSPEVIPEMARLALLSYLDRISDVGGVELDLTVRALHYVGVPFWRDLEGWTDGVFGLRFPPSLAPG